MTAIIPIRILYQPNMTKSWLATYLIKTFIINKALTNAVIKPIEKMGT
jgi:hypothetical protein